MQLFIRQFNQKNILVDYDPTITYYQLKCIIGEKINLTLDKFQIITNGIYLESKYELTKAIINMNIENNSTLVLKEIIFPIIKIK